ncbi:hypothetical protein SDC9_202738 [bioreactor metagenome]|uniref:Uncharacterized protein n=1 Tax=bioreactor metagenome TaxID=1076179 RepID=A0A645IX92_9ZZZZ
MNLDGPVRKDGGHAKGQPQETIEKDGFVFIGKREIANHLLPVCRSKEPVFLLPLSHGDNHPFR